MTRHVGAERTITASRLLVILTVLTMLATLAPIAQADAPTSGPPGTAGTRVDRDDGGLVPTSRYFGASRYDTASLIARDVADTADTVLLARGDNFPDSLAGAYLAGQLDAPVLLTPPTALADEVRTALAQLSPTRVLVLGGEAAVSDDVLAALRADGVTVERVAGDNRYATSSAIAAAGTQIGGLPGVAGSRVAILANGRNFPDALVAGAIAHDAAFPLLLTDPLSLPPETAQSLTDLGITDVIIVGGVAAVSAEVEQELEVRGIRVQRRSGDDRIATALDIADFARDVLGYDLGTVHVATGRNFPDALALSPLAGAVPGIVVLTDGQPTLADDSALATYLADGRCQIDRLVIAGGPVPVSLDVEATLRAAATRDASCPTPSPTPRPTPSPTLSPTSSPSPSPTPTETDTTTPTNPIDEVTASNDDVRRPAGGSVTISFDATNSDGTAPDGRRRERQDRDVGAELRAGRRVGEPPRHGERP